MSAVIRPRFDVKNRDFKRKFSSEAAKVLARMIVVENKFLEDLFNEELEATYDQLFNYYKEQWVRICETAPNYHCITNPYYFENAYKPQL